MKKKVLLFVILLPILFMVSGCDIPLIGGEPKKTHNLGKIAKTDIASFKLLDAKYTYALNRSIDNELGVPKEYNSDEDSGSPYVAAKGNTLVGITFSLENTDRSEIDMNWDWLSVKYNGKKYSSDIKYVAQSSDNINWSSYSSNNIIILSGKKMYYRCYLDIEEDVKNLDSDVELYVELPSSDKKEIFKYVVNKLDRKNYKGEPIELDVAIKNYEHKNVQNYFKAHMDDYEIMTGNEIKQVLTDKTYNIVETLGVGTWKGTFKFESSGNIFEGGNKYAKGYTNKRNWKVSENNLILAWINTSGDKKENIVQLKKIKDNTYLIVENNEPKGIIYKTN